MWKNSQTFSQSKVKVYVGMHTQSLSCVWLFDNPWIETCQASLSMSFSRQNIGVGCHFLLQEISLTQGSDLCLLIVIPSLFQSRYCVKNIWIYHVEFTDSEKNSTTLIDSHFINSMVILPKLKLGNLTCVKSVFAFSWKRTTLNHQWCILSHFGNAIAANLIFLNEFILNLQSKIAHTCETDTVVKSSGQLTFLESEIKSSCFTYFSCSPS